MGISRKLAAEGLGTLILVAAVIGSGIMGDALSSDDAVALLGNTVATGAILVVLVMIFGPISGAHFNPAVTLAFRLTGGISTRLALAYAAVQILGGLAGTGLAHLMFEMDIVQVSAKTRAGSAQLVSEAVATFALLAAIFGAIRFNPGAVPYAVGLVITAGYWWTASTSFANPAVAIARGFTDTFAGIRPPDIPAFVIAQLAAAALSAPLLKWLFAPDESV